MDHNLILNATSVLSRFVGNIYKDPAVLVDPDKKEDKSEQGD